MTTPPTKQQEVRCWNCKHLQKVYRGAPGNGILFSHQTHCCTITNMELDEYWKLIVKRACEYHVQSGNWEAPPGALRARQAWLAMKNFSQLSRNQRDQLIEGVYAEGE